MTRLCACGCGAPVRRKFAWGHNRRASVVEYQRTPTVERVLRRTVQEDRGHSTPCWVWQGGVNQRGYGQVGGGQQKNQRTHRAVYEALVGPIPDGLHLDHLCEVKRCCNPAHLEPVTLQENVRRHFERHPPDGTTRRGSRIVRTHCRNGHPWDANRRELPDGKTYCRACNLAACHRYMRRKKNPEGSVLSPRSGDTI